LSLLRLIVPKLLSLLFSGELGGVFSKNSLRSLSVVSLSIEITWHEWGRVVKWSICFGAASSFYK
jgi:hypothetical protein